MTDAQVAAVAGIIGAIVAAGMAGQWVFGWVHKAIVRSLERQLAESKQETAFWRGVALKAMGHTDRALEKIPDAEKPADGS